MRILLLILGLIAVAVAIWLYLRRSQWNLTGSNDHSSNEAEDYASLLNLYAQDCARHLDAAQNPERSWKDRMERLNKAEEAKQQHADKLGDAPTDMRGQDLDAPPSAEVHALRSELFNARKGDPDLPWHVLRKDEQLTHARVLERATIQLQTYGETESAQDLDSLIEEIYRDLIDRDPSSPTPYLRLIRLYRQRNDIDREMEFLQQALEQAEFDSEEHRQELQERLEHVRQHREA